MVRSFIRDPDLRSSFKPKEPAISVFDEDTALLAPPRRAISSKHQRALEDLRYQLAKEAGEQPRR